MKVGKGTGITHIMYQVHYLMPQGGPTPVPPWEDTSGLRLDLLRGEAAMARDKSIGLLGMMHTAMQLPRQRQEHQFTYLQGPFAWRLTPDFAAAAATAAAAGASLAPGEGNERAGKEITLVAAHLHGHGMVKRYETGLIKPWGERVPFAVIQEYTGYGPAQSFHPLPLGLSQEEGKGVKMGPGDQMYVSCTFDTRTGEERIRPPAGVWRRGRLGWSDKITYGVGHGQEMCGQLIYYHPFVAVAGPDGRMMRPQPRDEPGNDHRDNDLYNIFFNTTDI